MIGNLAYQTQRKIEADVFHEMLASIQYRLLHVQFDDGSPDEAMRLGMLSFATTIFLQWDGVASHYHHLSEIFKESLRKLKSSTGIPPWLILWLLIVVCVSVFDEANDAWVQQWLAETLRLTGVQSWIEGRKALRSIMWIDLLHDRPGKVIFEEAVAKVTGEPIATPTPDKSPRERRRSCSPLSKSLRRIQH